MNGQPEFIHIWYVGSPGALVSNLFKSGRCDLILRFNGTKFVQHIFNFFSRTAGFVGMFPRWSPPNFVKIRVLPLFSMELWVIF